MRGTLARLWRRFLAAVIFINLCTVAIILMILLGWVIDQTIGDRFYIWSLYMTIVLLGGVGVMAVGSVVFLNSDRWTDGLFAQLRRLRPW